MPNVQHTCKTYIYAAGCDKQDSLMRGGLCGKLHSRLWQFLLKLQQSSIR